MSDTPVPPPDERPLTGAEKREQLKQQYLEDFRQRKALMDALQRGQHNRNAQQALNNLERMLQDVDPAYTPEGIQPVLEAPVAPNSNTTAIEQPDADAEAELLKLLKAAPDAPDPQDELPRTLNLTIPPDQP